MPQKNNFKPFDNNVIHKEIDLIQGIINKMGQNSFLIKGWNVTLYVGFNIIIFKDQKIPLVYSIIIMILQILITLFLWYLDSFFLYTEKFYISWYKFCIVEKRNYTREWKYLLNINDIEKIMRDYELQESNLLPNKIKVFFSKTLLFFYTTFLLYYIIILIYLVTYY